MIFPPQEYNFWAASLHGIEKVSKEQKLSSDNTNFSRYQVSREYLTLTLLDVKVGGRIQDFLKVRKGFCRLSSASLNASAWGEIHCLGQGSAGHQVQPSGLWRGKCVTWIHLSFSTWKSWKLFQLYFKEHPVGCQLYQHPYLILVLVLPKKLKHVALHTCRSLHFHLPNSQAVLWKGVFRYCAGSHHHTCRGWGTRFRFVCSWLVKVNRPESIPNGQVQRLFSKSISQAAVERKWISPPRESLLPSLESAKPSMTFIPIPKVLRRSMVFAVRLYKTAEIFFPLLPPCCPPISTGWAILNSPLASFPFFSCPC